MVEKRGLGGCKSCCCRSGGKEVDKVSERKVERVVKRRVGRM